MKTYFAVIGMFCLVLAAWLSVRRFRAQFLGAIAAGTVVAHEVRESDDSIFHFPVVTFVDDSGKRCRFTSVAGGVAKTPALGAAVAVRYLPSVPTVAYISGFLHMWAAPVALLFLGAAGILSAWLP